MKRILFFIVCVSLIPVAFADVNTPDANAKFQNEALEKTCTEGIFTFKVPSNLTKIQGARSESLKSQMMQGGRELAKESGTADPNLFTESSLTFFSAYESAGGDLLFVLMGDKLPIEVNRDEMFNTNSERILWGKNSGQLSSESKGVSKLDIDGIPSLLMDIVSPNRERMQTYTFFVPDHPKHSFAIAFKSSDGKHQATIDGILGSLTIARAETSAPSAQSESKEVVAQPLRRSVPSSTSSSADNRLVFQCGKMKTSEESVFSSNIAFWPADSVLVLLFRNYDAPSNKYDVPPPEGKVALTIMVRKEEAGGFVRVTPGNYTPGVLKAGIIYPGGAIVLFNKTTGEELGLGVFWKINQSGKAEIHLSNQFVSMTFDDIRGLLEKIGSVTLTEVGTTSESHVVGDLNLGQQGRSNTTTGHFNITVVPKPDDFPNVAPDPTLKSSDTLPPKSGQERGPAKSSPKLQNLLPAFSEELQGSNPVRVRNPNDFAVATGLRSGERGVNFDVPANGVQTVYVPDGRYDIYFVYSNKPDALFQGDSFTLNNDGVEIQIVQIVDGNYNIKQVK